MKFKHINIPKEYSKYYKKEEIEENNRKVKIIPITVITASILYLLQYKFAPGKINYSIYYFEYIKIFKCLICISSLFLFLSPIIQKTGKTLVNEIFQLAYSFVMFAFFIYFTILDLQISADFSPYTIALFFIAFMLRMNLKKIIIFVLMGFTIYLLSLYLSFTSSLIIENILPIIVISSLSVIVVASRENTRKKIFLLNIKLKENSIKDPLTLLYNRRYMNEYLLIQIALYKRGKIPLSLLLIDIDFFKSINDTYGHSTGDSVLKELSEILLDSTRETDLVTRYGGEEFVIILSNTIEENAFMIAERIRIRVEQYPFNNIKTNVTISIGISKLNDNENDKELIDNADKNLYIAKNKGRNCTVK